MPLENTNSFRKMFTAIALCRGVFLDIPLLVLVYTALDALAWARYGDEVPDVKERFLRFCNEYLLNDGQLRCAALDLYSARCAMLHCLGWESRLSEKGHAKAVVYAFGPGQSRAIEMLEHKSPGRFVDVNADELASALEVAYERVRAEAVASPSLLARLQQAEGKQFASVPPQLAQLMAEHPTGFPVELLADPSEATSLYRASISFSL